MSKERKGRKKTRWKEETEDNETRVSELEPARASLRPRVGESESERNLSEYSSRPLKANSNSSANRGFPPLVDLGTAKHTMRARSWRRLLRQWIWRETRQTGRLIKAARPEDHPRNYDDKRITEIIRLKRARERDTPIDLPLRNVLMWISIFPRYVFMIVDLFMNCHKQSIDKTSW